MFSLLYYKYNSESQQSYSPRECLISTCKVESTIPLLKDKSNSESKKPYSPRECLISICKVESAIPFLKEICRLIIGKKKKSQCRKGYYYVVSEFLQKLDERLPSR
eukprot:TRINITY_DN428_c0_g1_i7.p1 TRINITY_DN428_c0_g1~~TRINITY_DN428_c0_g1_i7.p1  ORF type:complete len:106 (+),score=8.52 TRINITY_DN428_c0_g1_i7:60-377(+)